jgi:hypothetical protein
MRSLSGHFIITMPNYLVQIEAQNLLVDLDGSIAKRGFITFRCITADDAVAAGQSVLPLLRDDPELANLLMNETVDPPMINIINVTEIESFDEMPNKGQIWYDMKPKRWWQFWRR